MITVKEHLKNLNILLGDSLAFKSLSFILEVMNANDKVDVICSSDMPLLIIEHEDNGIRLSINQRQLENCIAFRAKSSTRSARTVARYIDELLATMNHVTINYMYQLTAPKPATSGKGDDWIIAALRLATTKADLIVGNGSYTDDVYRTPLMKYITDNIRLLQTLSNATMMFPEVVTILRMTEDGADQPAPICIDFCPFTGNLRYIMLSATRITETIYGNQVAVKQFEKVINALAVLHSDKMSKVVEELVDTDTELNLALLTGELTANMELVTVGGIEYGAPLPSHYYDVAKRITDIMFPEGRC